MTGDSYAKNQGFKARSGRMVRPQEDGSIRFELAHGYLDRDTAMDAEEYFQAKRDAELGRWRDPLNPDHLVVATEAASIVRAFDERTGLAIHANRSDANTFEPNGIASGLLKSAWAFFEAHPERKPWEDTKPGEVWLVRVADSESFVPVTPVESGHLDMIGNFGYIRPADVQEGRRIWPEDAS